MMPTCSGPPMVVPQGPPMQPMVAPPMMQAPPMMAPPQVPQELLDRLRAEAMSHAEAALGNRKAHCEKQVQLARVRVAELEDRLRRAEQEGDEMSTRLTMVELEKGEAQKAKENAEAQLHGGESEEDERVKELEVEVNRLKEENGEMADLKHTVMVLANELKRRMGQAKEETAVVDLAVPGGKWLNEVVDSPEDTDYSSVADSRSCSDSDVEA